MRTLLQLIKKLRVYVKGEIINDSLKLFFSPKKIVKKHKLLVILAEGLIISSTFYLFRQLLETNKHLL